MQKTMNKHHNEYLEKLLNAKTLLEIELAETNQAIKDIQFLITNNSESSEPQLTKNTPINKKTDFSQFKIVEKNKATEIKIPTSFSPKLKYPAKILFFLNKLGPLTVSEIIENIEMFDNSVPHAKLLSGITYAASMLYKDKKIEAEREGKANRYFLKSKETALAVSQ
jgi:DNA-binding transcriptional ArsR family regulator